MTVVTITTCSVVVEISPCVVSGIVDADVEVVVEPKVVGGTVLDEGGRTAVVEEVGTVVEDVEDSDTEDFVGCLNGDRPGPTLGANRITSATTRVDTANMPIALAICFENISHLNIIIIKMKPYQSNFFS